MGRAIGSLQASMLSDDLVAEAFLLALTRDNTWIVEITGEVRCKSDMMHGTRMIVLLTLHNRTCISYVVRKFFGIFLTLTSPCISLSLPE